MHKLVLLVCAAATVLSALALPSSSSTSTSDSDPLDSLFSTRGHWVDARNSSLVWTPSDAQSSTFRRNEHRWQGLVRLSRDDILDCLAGETVTVWGDSTARVLYYGLIHQLEPTAVTDKHANRVLSFAPSSLPSSGGGGGGGRNATFELQWDPVLGSNSYASFRPFLSTGRLAPLLFDSATSRFSPSPSPSPSPFTTRARPPALLLFSLGLWYIDPRPGMYPHARVPQYQHDVRAILALAVRLRLARVALVLAEVERPVEAKDVDAGGRMWHPVAEVDKANEWLRNEVERWKDDEGARARTHVVVGSVFNTMIANLSANTADGLHYDLALAHEMADVVLTAVCGPRSRPPRPGGRDPLDDRDSVCGPCTAGALALAGAATGLLGYRD
ncbi:hypothetical protein JCM8208_007585 [Rhodotorula glutinis]